MVSIKSGAAIARFSDSSRSFPGEPRNPTGRRSEMTWRSYFGNGARPGSTRPGVEIDQKPLAPHQMLPAQQPWGNFTTGEDRRAARDRPRSGADCRESHSGWFARRELVRKRTGNDSPGADATLEVAFRQKLGVCIQNGEPRDTKFGRSTRVEGIRCPGRRLPSTIAVRYAS